MSSKPVPGVTEDGIEAHHGTISVITEKDEAREANEVFSRSTEGVDFRTVSWQRATIIFLKIQFAMSILVSTVVGRWHDLSAVSHQALTH